MEDCGLKDLLDVVEIEEDFKPLFLDIETTGLNPFESEISMIGLYDEDFEVLAGNEKDIITSFLDRIGDNRILIGYNIKGFDIPFINTRCAVHDIEPAKVYALNTAYKIDLMHVVRKFMLTSNQRHSQSKVYQALGGEVLEDVSSSEAAELSKRVCGGDKEALEILKEHCINDLKKSMYLFEKLKPLCELYFWRRYSIPLIL